MATRTGEVASIQVSKIKPISNLNAADFELESKDGFLIKNESFTTIRLDVIPLKNDTDEWISTTFDHGWNSDLVRKVRQTAAVVDLKWGY